MQVHKTTDSLRKLKRTSSTNNLDLKIKSQLSLKAKYKKFTRFTQNEEDCVLCQKKIKLSQMPKIIQRALYRRYCSSLNYFYTKDINKILGKMRSRAMIQLKEIRCTESSEEAMISYVPRYKFKQKFDQLWKYHQFNIDQPRVFHKEVMEFVEYYFGGIRKMQENAIRKMLDILSDSELERCELNLEAFMNDRVEILEQKMLDNGLLKDLNLSEEHSVRADIDSDDFAKKKIRLNLSVIKNAGEKFEGKSNNEEFIKFGDCSVDRLSLIEGDSDNVEWPSFISHTSLAGDKDSKKKVVSYDHFLDSKSSFVSKKRKTGENAFEYLSQIRKSLEQFKRNSNAFKKGKMVSIAHSKKTKKGTFNMSNIKQRLARVNVGIKSRSKKKKKRSPFRSPEINAKKFLKEKRRLGISKTKFRTFGSRLASSQTSLLSMKSQKLKTKHISTYQTASKKYSQRNLGTSKSEFKVSKYQYKCKHPSKEKSRKKSPIIQRIIDKGRSQHILSEGKLSIQGRRVEDLRSPKTRSTSKKNNILDKKKLTISPKFYIKKAAHLKQQKIKKSSENSKKKFSIKKNYSTRQTSKKRKSKRTKSRVKTSYNSRESSKKRSRFGQNLDSFSDIFKTMNKVCSKKKFRRKMRSTKSRDVMKKKPKSTVNLVKRSRIEAKSTKNQDSLTKFYYEGSSSQSNKRDQTIEGVFSNQSLHDAILKNLKFKKFSNFKTSLNPKKSISKTKKRATQSTNALRLSSSSIKHRKKRTSKQRIIEERDSPKTREKLFARDVRVNTDPSCRGEYERRAVSNLSDFGNIGKKSRLSSAFSESFAHLSLRSKQTSKNHSRDVNAINMPQSKVFYRKTREKLSQRGNF